MYQQSARVYDALCRHKDYAAACEALRFLLGRVAPDATSLLDVACGTGQHLRYLCEHYQVQGLDGSREMLAIAREKCPGVPLHEGSLLDFRLPVRFDVVTCLFGSIAYATTPEDLRRAVACLARHLRPGGTLVVEPWIAPERFISGRLVFDRVHEADLAVARMYVTRREGRLSIFDSDYLIGTAEDVTAFRERQALGLFTDAEYREAFGEAALEVVDAGGDLFGYGLYVCRATGGDTASKG
ncbi:MAG TPA: class I SAM-dependent methyltransferase [Vicinamibacterales bacterium]|nr:class I SAM-dependent methyltransferase [Vicinamibacterales bacterium]